MARDTISENPSIISRRSSFYNPGFEPSRVKKNFPEFDQLSKEDRRATKFSSFAILNELTLSRPELIRKTNLSAMP